MTKYIRGLPEELEQDTIITVPIDFQRRRCPTSGETINMDTQIMELVASQIAVNAIHVGSGEGADLLGQEADQLSLAASSAGLPLEAAPPAELPNHRLVRTTFGRLMADHHGAAVDEAGRREA